MVISPMRRILLWASSTLTVLVLLFGYHTSTEGASGGGSGSLGIVSATVRGPGHGSGGGAASGAGGGNGNGNGGGSGSGSGSASGAAQARTVTGHVVPTAYGPVQVQLTVQNGSITGVAVPQYPTGSSTDAQINGYALPRLVQETLDAQSAHIDMVSGATFTSHGYLDSLQSALDQAGL